MLKSLFHLHLLARIEADLSWFLIKGLLSEKTGNQVLEVNRRLCNDIAPHALNLIDAFGKYFYFDINFQKYDLIWQFFKILGLPDEVLAAPIAQDWVKYNEIDNQGELGPKSEFMTNLKWLHTWYFRFYEQTINLIYYNAMKKCTRNIIYDPHATDLDLVKVTLRNERFELTSLSDYNKCISFYIQFC